MLSIVLLDPTFGYDVVEELGAIPIGDPELDRLRQEIVSQLSEFEALDSVALRRHLGSVGLGRMVDRLLRDFAAQNAWATGDADPKVDVRSRWRRGCEVVRREFLQEQLAAAQEALSEMPDSSEALARVFALEGAIQEAHRRQAEPDDV